MHFLATSMEAKTSTALFFLKQLRRWSVLAYSLCLLLIKDSMAFQLNMNLQPRHLVNADGLGCIFRGNQSQPDHFKLLERDGNFLLVGARNAVYNLSMETLAMQQKLEWPSSGYDTQMCKMKGKNEEECNNYIRVLVRHPQNGKTLICGTNAFRPLCRQYSMLEDGNYQMNREFDGFAISPYDPRTNSTAFYLAETDEIFTGTHSDFTAADPLIYRKSLSNSSPELRTPRHDLKLLSDPNFVASFDDREHVYFWFRETASECINCEKAVFGRIARVCKKDLGSTSRADEWTSFVKVRLNCSIPGEIPFHFDELQAATSIIRGNYGASKEAELVYAVFTTPYQGIQMSAVCAFRMEDVRHVFSQGSFKASGHGSSHWLPVLKSDLPQPRPGSCSDNSKLLSEKVVNFVKKNPLMDESVQNYFDQPLIVDNSFRTKFTQIAVHPQVKAVNGHKFDILFIGTEDGRVLKVINTPGDASRKSRSVLVESVQVFPARQAVENLLVFVASPPAEDEAANSGEDPTDSPPASTELPPVRLVAVSRDELRALPVHYCANMTTCTACVRLQDPYCAWDLRAFRCVGRTDGNWAGGDFAQSVSTGESPLCPSGEIDNSLYLINELYPQRAAIDTPLIYSAEGMAIGVVVTLAIASVIGFIIGYRLAWMKAESVNSSCASSSLYETATLRSKLGNHCGDPALLPLTNHIDVYGCPTTNAKLNDPSMNFVISLSESKCSNNGEKNPFMLNNGTLPKDFKTRKVYL